MKYTALMAVTLATALTLTVTVANATEINGEVYGVSSQGKAVVAVNNEEKAKVSLTDIKGHWGEKYITALVNAGGISGYPDGTFKPNNTISEVELFAIIIGATGNDNKVSGDWTLGIMKKAYDLKLSWYYDLDSYYPNVKEPVTRGGTAIHLITAAKLLRQEEIVYDPYWDLGSVFSDTTFGDSIASCYAMGLMSGKGNGTFDGRGNLTRAEAAAVVCRLIGLAERTPMDIPRMKVIAQYEILPDRSNTSPTVGHQDVGLPYEGAMFDGKAITRDPASGVLGFGNGQKGGVYLGLKVHESGRVINVNSELGFVYDLAGGYYQEKGGYTFFADEWTEIIGVANNKLKADGYRNSAGVFATDKAKEGMMADIHGNITTNASEAFFKVEDGMWVDQK